MEALRKTIGIQNNKTHILLKLKKQKSFNKVR